MKIFFSLLLILTSVAYSQDPHCEGDQYNLIQKSISVPNCINKKILLDSRYDVCKDCGDLFLKRYTEKSPKITNSEQQKLFIEILLEEYRKNITNNLIETIKLAALPSTGSSFKRSQTSCKMKKIDDFAKGCNSPAAIALLSKSDLFKNLDKAMSNELAKVLSDKDVQFQNTLLERDKPACFIPEKQLLYLTSSAVEESFTPELISLFKNQNFSHFKTMEDFFISEGFLDSFEGNIDEFKVSIKSHPFLNQIFNSPEKVSTFFKSIPAPYNLNSFRTQLYKKESGDLFDEKLASNCENSFENLKNTICSKDFENANLSLEPQKLHKRFSNRALKPSDDDFALSESLISKNLDVLKYCPNSSQKTKLNLSEKSKIVSSGLDDKYKEDSLKAFSIEKHETEIGKINNALCKMNDETCIEGTVVCSIYKKYKNIKSNPDSTDSKLANTSNPEVKDLLRSMIGDTTSADPKTKEILIAHGIIPQEDGKFIEQPDIPERRPDYFAKVAANPSTPEIAQAPKVTTPSSQQMAARRPSSEMYNDGYSNIGSQDDTSPSRYSMPDFSEITRDSEELRNIQNEIRRRLTELPVKNAPTKAEAKKILRDSFKARGRTLPAVQEERLAEEMVSVPGSATPSSQQQNFASNTEANRAAVSETDSQLEKWKKNQANAALMGMAGARAVSGNTSDKTASENSVTEKELSKVALNLPEDPSVRLSDIFANKYHANDPETQLLRVLLKNRNNFVLQIKSANFRVIFDEKQNLNLLLESGDKKEAERIRPQLEIFLKRLKT